MLNYSIKTIILAILFSAPLSFAANQTIHTLPSPGASQFKAHGQEFWQSELPAILAEYFPASFVNVNNDANSGLHSTSVSCTSPSFSTEAFTSPTNTSPKRSDHIYGAYTASTVSGETTYTMTSSTINYLTAGVPGCTSGTSIVRVAVCSVDPGGNFHQYLSSNYYLNWTDSGPSEPAGCTNLMDVTAASGALTHVSDLRVKSPVSNTPSGLLTSIENILGINIVSGHATSGVGSVGDPWLGWNTSLDFSRCEQIYYFPPGHYDFSSTINISCSHVTLMGAGWTHTFLRYTGTTGIAINANGGAAEMMNELELAHFELSPSDTTATKRAINVVDMRQSHIHDVAVKGWYGGGASVGFRMYGRDTSQIERCVFDADRPVVFSPDPYPGANIQRVGADTTTFRDNQYGQLVSGTAGTHPCIEVEDTVTMSRFYMEGTNAIIKCKHAFYWNAPNATESSQGGITLSFNWEQGNDQTGYLVYINFGPGGSSPIRLQNLKLQHVYGGGIGQGIYLRGIQGVASLDHVWYTGLLGNTNLAGVPLKIDAQAGAGPSLYASGATVTGSSGQFCNVITFSNCTNAQGILYLTGTNSVNANSVVLPNNPVGATCVKPPTTAVLTHATVNGTAPTATSCSGTIALTQGSTQGDGTFIGVKITSSFLDGFDETVANLGGLDPCDGSGGAPTGTHSCILGMRKIEGDHPGYGDIGVNASFLTNAGGSIYPNKSLMGTTIQFPSPGLIPATTLSASGTLAATSSVVPFLHVVDCPVSDSPCSGTFHVMRVRITIMSDDETISEAGDIYVNPFTWANFPNVAKCLSCSPGIGVTNPAPLGKFTVMHDSVLPPDGFFSFTNGFAVAVRWMASLEIIY